MSVCTPGADSGANGPGPEQLAPARADSPGAAAAGAHAPSFFQGDLPRPCSAQLPVAVTVSEHEPVAGLQQQLLTSGLGLSELGECQPELLSSPGRGVRAFAARGTHAVIVYISHARISHCNISRSAEGHAQLSSSSCPNVHRPCACVDHGRDPGRIAVHVPDGEQIHMLGHWVRCMTQPTTLD